MGRGWVLTGLLLGWPLGAQAAPDAGLAPSPDYGVASEALTRAYGVAPEPEVLLALAAVYDAWDGHCEEAIQAYRRFFQGCGSCLALPLAVERFENTVSHCSLAPNDEQALRESLLLRSPVRVERQPGDATRQEVAAILRDARPIDPPTVNALFLALVEAGREAGPTFLNDLRAKGWAVRAQNNASASEVQALLDRLRTVDLPAHSQLFRRFSEVAILPDPTGLNLLRGELQERLARSTTPPTAEEAENKVFCRVSPVQEFGFLTIDSKPWTDVYINGEKRGSTPLANAKVNAGCSTVLLKDSGGGREVMRNIDIRPNLVTRVYLDLDSGQERRSGPSDRD